MQKQKKMVSFENLAPELQELLKQKYPSGFTGHTQRIELPKETVNVINLETKDTFYMVKVKLVEKKRREDDDEDDDAGEDMAIPENAPGLDGEKDEFDDAEEDDSYGDEPVEEPADDDDED